MPLKLTRRGDRGIYYARGTVAGRDVYKSLGTSDPAHAEAIRIRLENDMLERAAFGVKATATFAEAAGNYLEAGGEGRYLAPILRYFGARKRLAEIDNATINEAARKLYPDAKPSTINRQLITPISAVMTMAAEDGLCAPVKLRRRKVKEQKTRWLTPEEFAALEAELSPHLIPLVGFMIGTGARSREALTLSASTLYLNRGQALLNTGDTKNDRPRMVRIPAKARAMMETRKIPERGPVFLTPKGKPYVIQEHSGGNFRNGIIAARLRVNADESNPHEIGPDVTPHTLRHTWATWFYAQTRDFGALLDLGGWSKADVANIYRKIAPDDLAERLLAHGWDFRSAGRIDGRQAGHIRIAHSQ